MIQLILHLIGDYLTQSDWMAQNKTKANLPAALHAIVYSLPFLFIVDSALAMFVICFSHYLIDRYRLARYVVYIKNIVFNLDFYKWIFDTRKGDKLFNVWPRYDWSNCSATGYPSDSPPWLAVWLLIAGDNTIHLAINYFSILFL